MLYDYVEAATLTLINWVLEARNERGLGTLSEREAEILKAIEDAVPYMGGDSDDHTGAFHKLHETLFPDMPHPWPLLETMASESITLVFDMADWRRIRRELSDDAERRHAQGESCGASPQPSAW